ncbi:secondary thiamine-phosphate synthase enzyme YjbQ [Salisediminibacterium halotolerans]|uniref:Secondary thiamine-phosphate synthase enzyme n=1 Tax=Salisediminibacterium halotolerans TaxID=517425 RepID=A0A1H9UX69_9BACI|nr:secondary thiamine-phosphate synthase enzyme YjbQ [Salisediminibacterium haloalkalitolerans]SES14036.1 secondary thiamine-phosphate synthase enzyme [Salisediminibacterium haloalkalitolerans]
MLEKHAINTKAHAEMVDITRAVNETVQKSGVTEGIVYIYSAHTTAGITINENADPDVKTDMIQRFDNVYPWKDPADRHMEGNTASHMKTSTVGASQPVIITGGEMLLGTWQGIYFCEYDGPRNRTVHVKVMSG